MSIDVVFIYMGNIVIDFVNISIWESMKYFKSDLNKMEWVK